MTNISGSILRHFPVITLSTADEKYYTLKTNWFNRLAIGLIGLPHLGFRIRAKIILELLSKMDPASKILDAGCGYGLYSLTLAEQGYYVDCLDIDAKRLATVKKMADEYPPTKKKLTVTKGSLTAIPAPADTYDVIICSDVVEHIKDDALAFSELTRVLKPGGQMAFSVPYWSKNNQKIFNQFGHERPGYTLADLKTWASQYHLQIKQVFYYEKWLGNILFKVFNSITNKPVIGLLFYPFYFLYLLDYWFGPGEPNGLVVWFQKTTRF